MQVYGVKCETYFTGAKEIYPACPVAKAYRACPACPTCPVECRNYSMGAILLGPKKRNASQKPVEPNPLIP